MPTAAKLIAAVIFAAVGWLAANAHVPALGEGASVGRFREIAALFGLVIGWRVMGNLVGQGYVDAIGGGLRSSVTLAVISLLLFSTGQMVRNAFRKTYDGPMEAVQGIFQLMMENALAMLSVGVIGVLIIGGIIGGTAAEWGRRHWK